MKDNTAIQCCSKRYYQGRGVLKQLGEQAIRLGKMALLISDSTVYPKVQDEVEASLNSSGVAYQLFYFTGHCSPARYDVAVEQGRAMGAKLVVGIGGGKIMDTAKIAADKLGVGAITVPTSAATCASTALLAVDYSDEGHLQGNYWPRSTPVATFADINVILDNCPVRYNIAGMVDTMAKYPEIKYNIKYCPTWKTSIMSTVAKQLAEQSYRLLISAGTKWLTNQQADSYETVAEDIVATVLHVTGLTSCLAFGGKQAAVSHCLYTYFSRFYPMLMQKYLHGELVGASLVFQIAIADGTAQEIEDLRLFLQSSGLPTNLRELGVSTKTVDMDDMFSFLKVQMPISQTEELLRIRSYEHLLTGDV